MKLALALLALSAVAHASIASLPEAPKPQPRHDYAGWSLLATDATLRTLDAFSTRRALASGLNHEDVLPDCLSHHTPAMYAYSGAVVGMDWYLARELKRHGHTKLARLPYIVDIGVELPTLSNFALPTQSHATMRRMP